MYREPINSQKYPKFDRYFEDVEHIKQKLQKGEFSILTKAFQKFSANPEITDQNQWYINYESLSSKFKKVFGSFNSFFCKVFYYFLCGGAEMEQIPFFNFLKAMSPFLSEDPAVVMRDAVFNFYDINQDGEISIMDLLQAQSSVSWDTQYGEEITYFVDKYVNEVLLGRQRRRTIYNVERHLLEIFINHSCIATEIIGKVLGLPTASWPKLKRGSIFEPLNKYSTEEVEKRMKKFELIYKNSRMNEFKYNKMKKFADF